eukprot:scaffold853_cov57-Phaeocystis_antarctica.AAC.2
MPRAPVSVGRSACWLVARPLRRPCRHGRRPQSQVRSRRTAPPPAADSAAPVRVRSRSSSVVAVNGGGSLVGAATAGRVPTARVGQPLVVLSFYISYRGFYAATWPPGAPRDPGPPSQTLWVGEDRAWPPCPRSGRSAPRPAACGAP